jgi:uncharacterized membrane protein (DUF2068 family)
MSQPPRTDATLVKKRAPTLYAIIGLKLLKGTLLLLLALGIFKISDTNLPELFREVLQFMHLDPEKKFFADLEAKIAAISAARMVWVAGGTFLYSLFSLVEGVGLLCRVSWAGWLAIGESMFFVPIEIYELLKRPSAIVLVVLGLNVFIVWYLLQNRHRLFRHHHH